MRKRYYFQFFTVLRFQVLLLKTMHLILLILFVKVVKSTNNFEVSDKNAGLLRNITPESSNLPELKSIQEKSDHEKNGDSLQIARANLDESLKLLELETNKMKEAKEIQKQPNNRLEQISSSFKQTNYKLNYFLITVGVCVLIGAFLRYVKNKNRETESEEHGIDIVDSANIESTDIMQIFKS